MVHEILQRTWDEDRAESLESTFCWKAFDEEKQKLVSLRGKATPRPLLAKSKGAVPWLVASCYGAHQGAIAEARAERATPLYSEAAGIAEAADS